MKIHISLNVANIDKSVDFYSKMFGVSPVKRFSGETGTMGGYAKFDLEDPGVNLTLNEAKPTHGNRLSHLGIQVASTSDVEKYRERWNGLGMDTLDEDNVVCCYAKQDKTWVSDPDGNRWEAFVVLENVSAPTERQTDCCVENETATACC
ncbi:MAG: ArsI/CadI family heavy metal resistance metalloenzyme [Pyrinomonadaceae bacterium]